MRFLFVVPPLTGHVNPTVSVARTLESRGHDVAWAAHPGTVAKLLPKGARIYAMPERADPGHVESVVDRAKAVRGAAALKLLWEDFLIPLARSMVPAVEVAVSELSPDVIISDQQAVAGGIVARKRGLPWATFATTSAGVVDPLAGLPQVKAWFDALIAGLESEHGLPHHGEMSPHLVVAFTTEAMVGPLSRFPAHYRFVGPSISDRPEATAFPWGDLAPAPTRRVLISMGTVNAEASSRFYTTAVDALRDEPEQMIIAAPNLTAPDHAAGPPAIIQPYVPQLALLPNVDAVICHGGHNTVCEALANGLPLVIAPIKDDQPIVADQVVAAGAGLRVKFGRVQAPELRAAVRRVLDERQFKQAAVAIQASFAAAGGASAAATLVEALA